MKKPNMFLVGCVKSGTTTLYELLKQHPQIFMSEVKGPDFFAEMPNDAYPQFFKKREKYLSLFNNAKEKKILGEASHYFHLKKAPEKIKKFNPKAKIVIILRNPFEVIRSYYNSDLINPSNNLIGLYNKKNPSAVELIDSLEYSENIKRWGKFFNKNVFVLIAEDLNKNPKEELSKLFKFLDVDGNFTPEFKIHNVSRKTKNKYLLWLIQLLPLKSKLFLKNQLKEKFLKNIKNYIEKITTKEEIKRKIPNEILKEIKQKINIEIEKTEKLLKKDLNSWRNNP